MEKYTIRDYWNADHYVATLKIAAANTLSSTVMHSNALPFRFCALLGFNSGQGQRADGDGGDRATGRFYRDSEAQRDALNGSLSRRVAKQEQEDGRLVAVPRTDVRQAAGSRATGRPQQS